ncbi:MAG: hypothetical protein P8P30_00335 [Rickettsiales bacterium]|nr:hypothetical protein [Rickettsiales bacterium]
MEMTAIKSISKRKQAFIGIAGVSLAGFGMGFGDCLFDIDKADACVAHAASWIDRFQVIGDHLINWAIAIVKAAFGL